MSVEDLGTALSKSGMKNDEACNHLLRFYNFTSASLSS